MKTLKEEFKKNDMLYKILERTKNFYFAELRSTETGRVVSYESGRIVVKKQRIIKGKIIEANEAIVSNEQFGKHPADMAVTVSNREKCHNNYLKYARNEMISKKKKAEKGEYHEAVHTN